MKNRKINKWVVLVIIINLSITKMLAQKCKYSVEKTDLNTNKYHTEYIVSGADKVAVNYCFEINFKQTGGKFELEFRVVDDSKNVKEIESGARFSLKLKNEKIMTFSTLENSKPYFERMGLKEPDLYQDNPNLNDSYYNIITYWYCRVEITKEQLSEIKDNLIIEIQHPELRPRTFSQFNVLKKAQTRMTEAARCTIIAAGG